MDRLLKTIAFWTLIVLAILFFYKFLQQPSRAPDVMDSIRFTEALRAGRIARVVLPSGAMMTGDLTEPAPDGKPARFVIATPEYRDLVDDLLRHNVPLAFDSPRETTVLTQVLGWLPVLLMIGVWVFFMRAMRAGGRRAEGRGGPIPP